MTIQAETQKILSGDQPLDGELAIVPGWNTREDLAISLRSNDHTGCSDGRAISALSAIHDTGEAGLCPIHLRCLRIVRIRRRYFSACAESNCRCDSKTQP